MLETEIYDGKSSNIWRKHGTNNRSCDVTTLDSTFSTSLELLKLENIEEQAGTCIGCEGTVDC